LDRGGGRLADEQPAWDQQQGEQQDAVEAPVDQIAQVRGASPGGQGVAKTGGGQGKDQQHEPARQAHVADTLGDQVELGKAEGQAEEPQGGEHGQAEVGQEINLGALEALEALEDQGFDDPDAEGDTQAIEQEQDQEQHPEPKEGEARQAPAGQTTEIGSQHLSLLQCRQVTVQPERSNCPQMNANKRK
jgi:hypothetical protein